MRKEIWCVCAGVCVCAGARGCVPCVCTPMPSKQMVTTSPMHFRGRVMGWFAMDRGLAPDWTEMAKRYAGICSKHSEHTSENVNYSL